MSEEPHVLAQQPPPKLLVQVALLYLAAFLAYAGMLTLFIYKNTLLAPWATWRVGLYVLALALAAILALWFLFHGVRVASRFFLPDAGVYVHPGKVLFQLPRVRAWWNPFHGLRTIEVPFADICHLHFSVATRSRLTVLTDHSAVEIPSGTFEIDNYALDARLRQVLAGAFSGSAKTEALTPLEPKRRWTASVNQRLLTAVLGLAFMLGPLAVLGCVARFLQGNTDVVVLAFLELFCLLSLLHGAAAVALAVLGGGTLVMDARGLFWENGGNLCFLSWEALSHGLVRLGYPALGMGLWKGLTLRTQPSFNSGAPCKVRLGNFLGMGFPLGEVGSSLATWLQRGSLPVA